MNLLAPAWLLAGALAIFILVLHMRRRRQLDVPSVMLWRLVENSATPRRTLRWPPPSLLLLLQVLVVLLVAVALAQPLFGADRPDTRHTIYVLDSSASMRATDLAPSRFDAAVAWLADRVGASSFDTNDRISVITAAAAPRVQVARHAELAGIIPLIDGLRATDGPADWDATAVLAGQLLRSGEETVVVLVTDGADPGVLRLSAALPEATVERAVFAGDDTRNVGLTAHIAPAEAVAPAAPAASAAPAAPADAPASATGRAWIIDGVVRFSGTTPNEITIAVLFQPDGTDGFVNWADIVVERPEAPAAEATPPAETPATETVAAPSIVEVAFNDEIEFPGPGAVLLRLPDDAGPHDNEVHFVLNPAAVATRILYVGEPTLPLVAALQAIEGAEIFTAAELPPDAAAFDLVVVDNVTVARRPRTNVLWLGSGRVTSQVAPGLVADPYVTGWDRTHPLSTQVDWTAIGPARTYRLPRLAGGTVLAESNGTPLVQARTTPDGREVQIAFDLATSAWPEQPGFPVFFSSLVSWLGVHPGALSVPPCMVGSPCPIEARLLSATIFAPDGAEAWTAPASGGDFLLAGVERTFVPDRAGFYRLDAGDETRLIAVNAVIDGETALTPVEGDEIDEPSSAASPRVWWWLLVVALLVLLTEAWIAGRGPEQFLRSAGLARGNPLVVRRRLQLGIRVAASVFLFAAIAGLPWLGREPAEEVVVVMGDHLSPDVANADRDRLLREVEANTAGGGRGGLVTAGAATRVATDLGGAIAGGGAGTPGTNLEDAVLLAAAMVPGEHDGRIVLATDGNETDGEVAQVIAALQARGLTVDIQPVNELPLGEVLVESVNAPAKVYAGDIFALDAVIFAQGTTTGTVTITRAGEVLQVQPIDLFPGRNRVEVQGVPAGDAGGLLIEVAVEAAGDTFTENNLNGIIVAVQALPAIAIVTPQPPLGEYFAGALAVQGLSPEIILPEDAPTTIEGWLAYDLVVLMNVPAIDLDTTQQEQLEEFVQVHGRGLLVLGGENAFGPGGYYQTPFERLSPLSSRVPHELPQVAIVYVLDRSGSMSAAVEDVTRLDIAKQATISAISLLNPNSLVGIVLFDSSAYVLTALAARDTIGAEAALAPVIPGGGTNIFPGLDAALGMLANVDSATKHVVVMTDGITVAADFPALVRVAQQLGITVSTIAIGVGDDERLAGIAAETGGDYYATRDFKAMPSILAQEALMLAGDPIQERVAPVIWLDRSAEFLTGWPENLPPVYSYVVTTAKPQADVHLGVVGEDGEIVPLLATWRYGNGHVLALATHGAGAGTAEWIQLPEYPLMWSQIIRDFLPDTTGPGLSMSLARNGDVIRVTADYLDPAGAPLEHQAVAATIGGDTTFTIPLEQVVPGRYEGTFAVGAPGTYRVEVAADDQTADGEIYVAYPARFDFVRADFDKLRALAAATGGQLLLGDEPVFGTEMRWVAVPGWRIWALIALLLFLTDLTVRHAPNLLGLRRRAGALGPALAVPA